MCAVVFMLFSFCWLYAFQNDVLAVTQHVLSQGQTTYDRTVGAVIITAILQVVQLLVCAIVRLYKRTHALTYFPSMLLMASLCAIKAGADGQYSFGIPVWVIVLLSAVWVGLVTLCRKMLPFDSNSKQLTGLLSQRAWGNMLQMAAMMLLVAWLSNTNAVFHYRAHAEVSLIKGDAVEVLRTGQRSLETDESLTMLRILALAQCNELGDRLFEYPLKGTSADMLPDMKGSRSRLMLLSPDTLWSCLRGRPATPMATMRFLELLARYDSVARPVVGEYRLCGHLIDRQLDAFAELLPYYYNKVSVDSLPRYYREAVFLHGMMHQSESSDSLMQQQWDNYQQQSSTMTPVEAFTEFGKTYWYYYQHQSR